MPRRGQLATLLLLQHRLAFLLNELPQRLLADRQMRRTGQVLRDWREKVMGLFYEWGYEAAWDTLVAWRSSLRGGKRKAADRLLGYIAERRETIRYPQFRDRGWQIGSGPTEAQCKAATQRLKGRGRRWDRANAEALMALECLENSHAWHLHWRTLDPTTN